MPPSAQDVRTQAECADDERKLRAPVGETLITAEHVRRPPLLMYQWHVWRLQKRGQAVRIHGRHHIQKPPAIVWVCLGLVWFGLVWLGLVWLGLAWSGLVWLGLVWFGLVWFGLVWLGLVWFGLLWFGLVWFGVGEYLSLDCKRLDGPRSHQATTMPMLQDEGCTLYISRIKSNNILQMAAISCNEILRRRPHLWACQLSIVCIGEQAPIVPNPPQKFEGI